MKIRIILVIMALFLVGIGLITIVVLRNNFSTTGKTILNEYSYTKAVCNSTNFCQDYEIYCKNREIVDRKPITGAAIQYSEDWKDPRENGSEIKCS